MDSGVERLPLVKVNIEQLPLLLLRVNIGIFRPPRLVLRNFVAMTALVTKPGS